VKKKKKKRNLKGKKHEMGNPSDPQRKGFSRESVKGEVGGGKKFLKNLRSKKKVQ